MVYAAPVDVYHGARGSMAVDPASARRLLASTQAPNEQAPPMTSVRTQHTDAPMHHQHTVVPVSLPTSALKHGKAAQPYSDIMMNRAETSHASHPAHST